MQDYPKDYLYADVDRMTRLARTARSVGFAVVPTTHARVIPHNGSVLWVHALPPSDIHDYPIRRFLELNPQVLAEAETSFQTQTES